MSSAELAGAVDAIRRALPAGAAPAVGLILGSGLGAFADTLEARVAVPFEEIPGLPPSTIVGPLQGSVWDRC